MINIASETVVSLCEAAANLPRRRRGKKPHVATLYRWSITGCKGVKLETIQVGGTRCTSLEALQRFINALSGVGEVGRQVATKMSPSHEQANRQLEEGGW